MSVASVEACEFPDGMPGEYAEWFDERAERRRLAEACAAGGEVIEANDSLDGVSGVG